MQGVEKDITDMKRVPLRAFFFMHKWMGPGAYEGKIPEMIVDLCGARWYNADVVVGGAVMKVIRLILPRIYNNVSFGISKDCIDDFLKMTDLWSTCINHDIPFACQNIRGVILV